MKVIIGTFLIGGMLVFAACSKSSNQQVNISGQQFSTGTFIDNGDTLNSKDGSNGRSIKGTLKAGQTYYLCSLYADATINSGDTLAVQSGVQVLIVGPASGARAIGTQDHAPGIVVNGTFLCLGTKAKLGRHTRAFAKVNNLFNTITTVDLLQPNPGYASGIVPGQQHGDRITVMRQTARSLYYLGCQWSL